MKDWEKRGSTGTEARESGSGGGCTDVGKRKRGCGENDGGGPGYRERRSGLFIVTTTARHMNIWGGGIKREKRIYKDVNEAN
jgi:hypothetical protein